MSNAKAFDWLSRETRDLPSVEWDLMVKLHPDLPSFIADPKTNLTRRSFAMDAGFFTYETQPIAKSGTLTKVKDKAGNPLLFMAVALSSEDTAWIRNTFPPEDKNIELPSEPWVFWSEPAVGTLEEVAVNALIIANLVIDWHKKHQETKSEKAKCHWCSHETESKQFVQAVTGRVFCSLECWNDYLRSEGFKV